MDTVKITRALVSVSEKAGIVELARKLVAKNIEILSTGGTAKLLKDNNIAVTSVDSYTGFPEIMDGRVKTLHPKIHGGLLCVRDNAGHAKQAADNKIEMIDLVIVNLYPFEKTIAKPGVTAEEAVEQIDIGGPSMVRSAAKNHRFVTVVVDPADYQTVLDELDNGISLETRKRLAVKAFRHTSAYDASIEHYFSQAYLKEETLHLDFYNGETMRYGENPHQSAVFFKNPKITEPCLAIAEQLHGKELSYNNIVDGDAALEAVKELAATPAASVIKHMNPCGYATGATLEAALGAAWDGDPVSAYGSVIAVTRTVDLAAARVLEGRFVEILIAPDFDADALEYLREKSKMIRLLKVGSLQQSASASGTEHIVYKHVIGGMLAQGRDFADVAEWKIVTKAAFPGSKEALARFAWKASKHTKSNAIVLAQEYTTGQFQVIGMGAGQPNRVDSLRKLSITKARTNLEGKGVAAADIAGHVANMVMASDAFFPFADTVDEAHDAGIRYIVQPGGSKRDDEVIAACDKYGIAMAFTGMRHFRH